MPIQTSVTDVMPRGFPGTIRSDTRTMTVINVGTAEIPFGVGVVQAVGTANLPNRQAATLPSGATNIFLGVAIRDFVPDTSLGTTLSGPKANQPVLLGYDGEVLVRVETAVVKGGTAFMRFATSANGTQLGAFRADADTNTAVALLGCSFRESAAAGSLVWMRIDDAATRASMA